MATTNNVETLAGSGAKPQKKPTDPFVMLNEIDVDKISNIEKLKEFIYLCDRALKFLDDDFAMDETKMAHHTSSAKKISSSKRYKAKRQAILNKKKRAESNRVAKVVAHKMSLSKKTKTGRLERKYNTPGHVREGRWNGRGTSYQEWLEPANVKNSAEMRELATEWAKPAPKQRLVVEYWNREKEKAETVDADLFTIRKCKEIKELFENANKV